MRYLLLLLSSLFLFPNCSQAQTKKALKVLITKHGFAKPGLEQQILMSFREMLSYVHSKRSDFYYNDIDIRHIDYHDGPTAITEDAIATITPLKYIKFQRENKANLIPILITQKRNEPTPYYSAILISSKKSRISSIYSPHIRKVYFVDTNSTSGFLALVLKLHEEGIISKPTLAGINEKKWNYEFCESHRDVENKVTQDTTAIGAVWNYQDWPNQDSSNINVLLRYDHFPQDPLVISKNLEPFKEEITEWLMNSFINDDKIRSVLSECMGITGFLPYRLEHENAFIDVYNKFKKTREFTANKSGNQKVFVILTIICCLSFFAMFYFAVMSIKSVQRRKTYTSISWGAFTTFLLLCIEIMRLYIENFVHHNSYINTHLHENSYFITIGVGIILASLAEFKNKFAAMICKFLRSIIVLLEATIETFQRKDNAAK